MFGPCEGYRPLNSAIPGVVMVILKVFAEVFLLCYLRRCRLNRRCEAFSNGPLDLDELSILVIYSSLDGGPSPLC